MFSDAVKSVYICDVRGEKKDCNFDFQLDVMSATR